MAATEQAQPPLGGLIQDYMAAYENGRPDLMQRWLTDPDQTPTEQIRQEFRQAIDRKVPARPEGEAMDRRKKHEDSIFASGAFMNRLAAVCFAVAAIVVAVIGALLVVSIFG